MHLCRFNPLGWLIVLGIFLIIPLSSYGQAESDQDSPVIKIPRSDWLWRLGDSPVDDQGMSLWIYEDTSSPEWQPMTDRLHVLSKAQGHFLWLMIRVPEGHWKHPALLLTAVSQSLEVYQNRQRVFRSGELKPAKRNKYWMIKAHLIPLESVEAGTGGDILFLRIFSDFDHIGIEGNKIWLGSPVGLIEVAVKYGAESFILGPLFTLAGLFAIFVYLRRRKQKLYIALAFGAFVTCLGIAELIGNPIVALSSRAIVVRYFLAVTTALLWPVGFYIFIEQVIGRGYKSLIRRLWQVHILNAVIVILLDTINVIPAALMIPLFFGLLTLGILVGIPMVVKAAVRGSFEARILSIGMGAIMLCGAHDILMAFGVIPIWLGLFAWGTLILILLLAYILEHRFAQTHRQLEEYSLTLEQKVEDRTQELSERNVELARTLEQLRETQDQLIMQEKMASLGDLVAGVAHEMNNPIGVIHSAADTTNRGIRKIKNLLKDGQDGNQIQQSFDMLERNNEIIMLASDRVAKIVQSLRTFARLDEALFQQVNLHDNIDTTLTLFQHELRDRATVIKKYGDIPLIQCYPNELNQVFMNLLRNASQSIEQQGTITISTHADESMIYIEISDTGRGIPAEDIPKIFNPGFTTQGVGVGKGLGLSIVYNVIHKHHGDIEINSEVGNGTQITIMLPIGQTAGDQK